MGESRHCKGKIVQATFTKDMLTSSLNLLGINSRILLESLDTFLFGLNLSTDFKWILGL